jgi:hypothetical protein
LLAWLFAWMVDLLRHGTLATFQASHARQRNRSAAWQSG